MQLIRHTLDEVALVNLVYPNIARSSGEWERQLCERGIVNVHPSSFETGRIFLRTAVQSCFNLSEWECFCEGNWSQNQGIVGKLFLREELHSIGVRLLLWEQLFVWVEGLKSGDIEFRHS